MNTQALNDNHIPSEDISRIVFAGFEIDDEAYIKHCNDLWSHPIVERVIDLMDPDIGFQAEGYSPQLDEVVIHENFDFDITENILKQFESLLEPENKKRA